MAERHPGARTMKSPYKIILAVSVMILSLAASPPRYGGSLVLGTTEMPQPIQEKTASLESLQLYSLVYENFFTKNENSVPVSSILEVQVNQAKTRYILKLRENITYHDGTIPTAEDLFYSLERAEKIDPLLRLYLDDQGLMVLDEDRLEISFKSPAPGFIEALCSKALILLPEKKYHSRPFPPGTGPFIIQHQDTKQLHLIAFPKHHKGRPYLDSITIRKLPEKLSPASAIKAGYVNASWGNTPKTSGFVNLAQPAWSLVYLAMGSKTPIMDNIYIRRALACAIDIQTLLRVFLPANGRPATGFIPPSALKKSLSISDFYYDPQTAQDYLSRGAQGQSIPLLELVYPRSSPDLKQVAERIQVDLLQIGLRVKLQELPQPEIKKMLSTGQFDLALNKTTCISGNPEAMILPFLDTSAKPAFMQMLKAEDYKREDILAMLEKELLQKARFIPLYHTVSWFTLPADLYNASIAPPGILELDNCWYLSGDKL